VESYTSRRDLYKRRPNAVHHAREKEFLSPHQISQKTRTTLQMIDSRIVLINGIRLCNLMIDDRIGVTRANSYEVKRLDSDYFEES
jgi:restriction system protein